MLILKNSASKSTNNAKDSSSSPKIESEKLVVIIGSLLFVFFTILLNLIAPTLFQLGIKFFEEEYVTKLLQVVPFVAISALFSAICLYLLSVSRVLISLFQDFWHSLEDED